MAAAPAPAPPADPPKLDEISTRIANHNKKPNNEKTLEEALKICNDISKTDDFNTTINKYNELSDSLVIITDYKDQNSGSYKFKRVLETYLAINNVFENDITHFSHDGKLFVKYNSKEGILPFKNCYIYKKFVFTTDADNKYYVGLKESDTIVADDFANLKALFKLVIDNNTRDDIKTDDNKLLNMYFIEGTTKVRKKNDGTPITNIYSLALVNNNIYEGLQLEYYKVIMKDESTNTVEINLVDANIP